MAFVNEEGKKISYECDDLIRELEEDIEEFGGNTLLEVVTEEMEGVTIYKDYNFIDKNDEENRFVLTPEENIHLMTATALLTVYKKQNSILD